MFITDPLQLMHNMLEENYLLYQSGKITEKEYLISVKPIDETIGKLEMAILQDTLVLSEASLRHSLMREH